MMERQAYPQGAAHPQGAYPQPLPKGGELSPRRSESPFLWKGFRVGSFRMLLLVLFALLFMG